MAIDLAKEMPDLRAEVGRKVLEILAENYMGDTPVTYMSDKPVTDLGIKKATKQSKQLSPLQEFNRRYSLTDRLDTILGSDSLEGIEFIYRMEDEFGIEIEDDDIGKVSTLKELLAYLNGVVPPHYRPNSTTPLN